MDPTEGGQHDTPISSSYGIHDNGILLSTPLTESHYNIGSSRNQCDILRNGSSSGKCLSYITFKIHVFSIFI